MKLMKKDPLAQMLLTPSNTPEFSPVENLFGLAKKRLLDMDFKTKE